MFFDFGADIGNLAFGYDVSAADEYYFIGDAIHLMQDVARDHHMHALFSERLEERHGSCARPGIETIQGFIENQDGGMMAETMGHRNTLAHDFAASDKLGVHRVGQL